MSHDGSWRAACSITIHFLWFQIEAPLVARGVTAPVVGSGALSGFFILCGMCAKQSPNPDKEHDRTRNPYVRTLRLGALPASRFMRRRFADPLAENFARERLKGDGRLPASTQCATASPRAT
jgi:hypothetical protein